MASSEPIELFHIPTEFWIRRPENATSNTRIQFLDALLENLQSRYSALESKIELLESIRVEFYKQLPSTRS